MIKAFSLSSSCCSTITMFFSQVLLQGSYASYTFCIFVFLKSYCFSKQCQTWNFLFKTESSYHENSVIIYNAHHAFLNLYFLPLLKGSGYYRVLDFLRFCSQKVVCMLFACVNKMGKKTAILGTINFIFIVYSTQSIIQ